MQGVNQTREACVACDMSWERGRWSTRAEDSAANMGLCLRYVDLTPVVFQAEDSTPEISVRAVGRHTLEAMVRPDLSDLNRRSG